jgi:hypothetical protein
MQKIKLETRYGVLFAFVVIAYVMVEHFIGINNTRHDIGEYSRFAGVLAPIIGIFFAIKAKRDKAPGGLLTMKRGIKAGTIVAIVQTTITTAWFTLYGNVINPTFLSSLLEYEKNKMLVAGTGAAAIEAKLNQMQTLYSLPVQPIFQEAFGITYGIVFAVIFSLFLKRRAKSVGNNYKPRIA